MPGMNRDFCLCFCIILLGLLIFGVVSDAQCGESGWTRRTDTPYCYYKSSTRVTFSQANVSCNDSNSNLLSILDEDEMGFIQEEIQNCQTSPCEKDGDEYWIGLFKDEAGSPNDNKLKARMGWRWLDNAAYEYDNWKTTEPEGHEQCARLNTESTWNGIPCTNTYGFICKKLLPSSPPASDPDRVTKETTTTISATAESPDTVTSQRSVGLPIGVSVGAVAVTATVITIVVFMIKKRRKGSTGDTEGPTLKDNGNDPVYYNNVQNNTKSGSTERPGPSVGSIPESGYDSIQASKEHLAGTNKVADLGLYPGHASYAEVGHFDRTVEYNLVYDTGRPKDTTSGDKDGQYDLPNIKEVSAGTEPSGRTGGNRKPAPRPKPSFLKRLKKPSIFRNDQGGEKTGKSHGGNIKKSSRRSIRDLYAAVDFTKKRKPRQ